MIFGIAPSCMGHKLGFASLGHRILGRLRQLHEFVYECDIVKYRVRGRWHIIYRALSAFTHARALSMKNAIGMFVEYEVHVVIGSIPHTFTSPSFVS